MVVKNHPGPADYEPPKKNAEVKESLRQHGSSQFLSKAPKSSIYVAEEKRIMDTYGERAGLKYKIKLNDEILDKKNNSVIHNNIGRLKLGSTAATMKHSSSTTSNKIKKNSKVGPTDYDPKKVTRRFPTTIIKEEMMPEPALGNVRDQMEFYLNRIFDSKGGKAPHSKKNSTEVAFH